MDYTIYAYRVNSIARENFEKYRKAVQAHEAAQERAKKYPAKTRINPLYDADYIAEKARADAHVIETQAELEKAKRDFRDSVQLIAPIRKELEADLAKKYAADPAKIDEKTLELLKGDILSAEEYTTLLQKTAESGNYTMVRLIGKYAGDKAKAIYDKNPNDEKAAPFRVVATQALEAGNGAEKYLKAFDTLTDVYTRCTTNARLIDHWSELTGMDIDE